MEFKKLFLLEASRFLSRRKVVILLLFYLLAWYLLQSGIARYESGFRERKKFQEFEKTRIENFQYYAQYGTYGFRLLYTPGPLSALFNNAGIISTNLNAFVDSGERMKIYESFKGKNAFIGYTSIFLNLTGLILLFGSLLALLYGFEAYKDRTFLKFLEGIVRSRRKLFGFVLISRLFLLLIGNVIITLTVWFIFLLNGLPNIDVVKLFLYSLVSFLMLACFLIAGMLASSVKNRMAGMISVFAIWLLFVFFIPAMVGEIVYGRAESLISTYKMEMEKLKLMMSIEKQAKEQAGKLDVENTNTKIRQQLHEYFLNNEFKKIFNQEKSMIKEMKGIVALHHNLSLVFPSSFFLSVNNEISGRGYENLIAFYEHVSKLKVGFIQYYAEKSFFSDEKTITPYLKGEENIFYAPSL
jgi:ABC-type transport system involved in multi-copper enzyme maturation permease subunit